MEMSDKYMIRLAGKIHDLGYTVYLSKCKTYGFYTNGVRCISFTNHTGGISISSNYRPTIEYGTGWRILHVVSDYHLTRKYLDSCLRMDFPQWLSRTSVPLKFLTCEEYLAAYRSSAYELFTPLQKVLP